MYLSILYDCQLLQKHVHLTYWAGSLRTECTIKCSKHNQQTDLDGHWERRKTWYLRPMWGMPCCQGSKVHLLIPEYREHFHLEWITLHWKHRAQLRPCSEWEQPGKVIHCREEMFPWAAVPFLLQINTTVHSILVRLTSSPWAEGKGMG